jgi:transposase
MYPKLPDAVLESQRISVIDSTGLENEINMPITQYGGKDAQKEARLILVLDQVTSMPLYFRLQAGNIPDVSTLETTFNLMNNLGLKTQMILMDAGYYSEKT